MLDLEKRLGIAPSGSLWVIMPISRLLVETQISIGDCSILPPDAADWRSTPLANQLRDVEVGIRQGILSGRDLREFSTVLTGFSLEILHTHPVVAFTAAIDWNSLLLADHSADIALLKTLTATVERALDVVRFDFCRLDLPDTLPGTAGSWSGSDAWLGALLFSSETKVGYLIAGAAVESTAVVKGIGLGLDSDPRTPLLRAADGEVAAVAIHGLSLLSEAMSASSETAKFTRMMTLLEFLASPYQFSSWKKVKGEISCHCARTTSEYHRLAERFRELTSSENADGSQGGLRTLVVHHGRLLHELVPKPEDRLALFREIQGYASSVLRAMIDHAEETWEQFQAYRAVRKSRLGVA